MSTFARLSRVTTYRLSGVSYPMLLVASGGVLTAAVAFVAMTEAEPAFSASPLGKLVFDLGNAAFSLLRLKGGDGVRHESRCGRRAR